MSEVKLLGKLEISGSPLRLYFLQKAFLRPTFHLYLALSLYLFIEFLISSFLYYAIQSTLDPFLYFIIYA